ncbi:MAG TPA: copper chaperone PCu(A)C [Ilumatobacteraceae bacterium]|nr:copper chaperone PCu(A)C [Ilumatobacteraceae bacterium]
MGMRFTSRPTTRSIRQVAGAACVVGLLTLVASCGDDDSSSNTTVAAANTTATGEIAFTGQWARTSPMKATMGAAYVTITSPIDDKLLGVSADSTVAATVEVHETYAIEPASDTTMMGSATTVMGAPGGEMGMRPVESIALPAGTPVELKPGGYHIMLIDLVKPLEVGATLTLTLTFEKAGAITLDVPVLTEAP